MAASKDLDHECAIFFFSLSIIYASPKDPPSSLWRALPLLRFGKREGVLNQSRYIPIEGLAEFNRLSAQLILGKESRALKEGRYATLPCVHSVLSST
jgi:hypothetical protein